MGSINTSKENEYHQNNETLEKGISRLQGLCMVELQEASNPSVCAEQYNYVVRATILAYTT